MSSYRPGRTLPLPAMEGIPTSYLEAYPFPAFVLSIPTSAVPRSRPRLISRDTDITVTGYEDVSPLSIPGVSRDPLTLVWANEKWSSWTQGKDVEECLESQSLQDLNLWIEEEIIPGTEDPTVCHVKFKTSPTYLTLTKTIMPSSLPNSSSSYCIITSQKPAYQPLPQVTPPTPSIPYPHRSSSSSASYFDISRGSSDEYRTSFSSDVGPSVSEAEDRITPLSAGSSSWSAPGSRRSGSSGSDRVKNIVGRKWRPASINTISLQQIMQNAGSCWKALESVDWASTEIGPREEWAQLIDPIAQVAFQSKFNEAIFLGKELRLIYNLSYSKLLPANTGTLDNYGAKGTELWAVLMEYLNEPLEKAFRGEPVFKENDLLLFEQLPNGQLNERYHTWKYSPIFARDGTVFGIYNQAIEVTETVLAERRLNTVRDLSDHTLVARTTRELFDSIAEVLSSNPHDAPFMLAYSVHPKSDTIVDLKLESTIGVPENHHSAPSSLTLSMPYKPRSAYGPASLSSPTLSAISALSSGSGRVFHTAETAAWPIQRALQTRQCVIVDDCRELIKDYPIRAWSVLPESAIVIPMCTDSSLEVPEGVVIIGLNVQRPFDQEYDAWIHLIRSQLANTLVSVKRHEEEARKKADFERMERAKAAWFRGAAHDLRNPLTLIAGPLEDALDDNLTGKQRTLLETAKRNLERLTRLVTTLMNLSKVEAGRMEGRFVPTELAPFLRDLVTLFIPAVERLKIEFIIQIPESTRIVYIDPVQIETVVSNCIGNALKFTETGSITVRLEYTDMAEISVIDTGVGIPREELNEVTEWYHRASTVIRAGTQGTGLGMALSRELLRLHGGELIIDSSYGPESGGKHGSTFKARIPLEFKETAADPFQRNIGAYGKQVADEAMRWTKKDQEDESVADSEQASTDTSTKAPEGLLFEKTDKVLVVEDNLDIQKYIKAKLTGHCNVFTASTGAEGLAKALQDPPDLVIACLNGQGMDSIGLLRAMRSDEQLKITPFIVLSASASDDTRLEALTSGAEDFIAKPFKPQELIARIHLHLQVGKKQVQLEKLYQEREFEVKLLSDYCPSGIMRADMNGRLTYGNTAWRILAGMGPEDAPDSWTLFASPEVREAVWGPWQDFLSPTREDPELRLEWTWLNGTTVSAKFIRLDLINPEMSGILGCLTDISHERQQIEDAERRRIEAEESKRQQEQLIDLTSHEIRTPVSAILQCSSVVKENLLGLNEDLVRSYHSGKGYIPSAETLAEIQDDLKALESIHQCGLVQERIAGDILSFAKIQMNLLSMHDIDIEIRKEARKVIDIFRSEAKTKNIDLITEFGQTMDELQISGLKTDPTRLGQVITNLVVNAMRFTAQSPVRRITIRFDLSLRPPSEEDCALPDDIGTPDSLPLPEDTPVWMFVSIIDTGPGLPEKEQKLLFQRFSQGNKMIHTRYGGSGLGLFICRQITEMFGGRIEVTSKLGEGSTFRFFIQSRTTAASTSDTSLEQSNTFSVSNHPAPGFSKPSETSPTSRLTAQALVKHDREDPALPPAFDRSTSSLAVQTDTGTSVASEDVITIQKAFQNMHVLIVEDNDINREVLRRQLKKAKFEVEMATHGKEAVDMVFANDKASRINQAQPFDLVLMDLEMPVMDGLTALGIIRDAEGKGEIKRHMIVALTGNARKEQKDHAIAAGMDDVIIKPYVLKDLVAHLKGMIEKKREIDTENQG